MANFTKTKDKKIVRDGNVSDDRFILMQSDELDYKLHIVFHACGYNNIQPTVNSVGRPIWSPFSAPDIYVCEDGDGEPTHAEAYIPSMRVCAADMPDLQKYVQRVNANLMAINDIIRAVNAGERFLD